MHVLVVESHPGLGTQAARDLEQAGHVVHRCVEDGMNGPCVGLSTGGECPLDVHDIAVGVVARIGPELQHGEHGALCSARHRIPLVTIAEPDEVRMFSELSAPAGSDLVAAVHQAAASGARHEAAVRAGLVAVGVLEAEDLDGPEPVVQVEVERMPRRLAMTLRIPAGDAREAAILKSATEALRRFDPYVAVIDVAIRR